jgi:hypothetical protein
MLANKLCAQHEAANGVVFAVNFLRVARQMNGANDSAPAQSLPRTLYVQILDQNDGIAVLQDIAN